MPQLISTTTAGAKVILFQASDDPLEAALFMPDPLPEKLILIATGGLEIPIRLGETVKEALLRWKADRSSVVE